MSKFKRFGGGPVLTFEGGSEPPKHGPVYSKTVAYVQWRRQDFFMRGGQGWSPRGRPWPRRSPRGHILKSLALASKPQVLENCPVLGRG